MNTTIPDVSIVIPNFNGRRWLDGCLDSLDRQQLAPGEVIVVDNGSTDGSVQYLRSRRPAVHVVELGQNTGFAVAANRGLQVARGELTAVLNTDVVLAEDWLARTAGALAAHPEAAAVACKMLSLAEPSRIYDAGDILRRDGACDQRGRFTLDDGRFDEAGDVFGACAGAAVYRRRAVLELGGFDEAYFMYLEDVDLALRLRLAGWTCRYEPAVAYHAGEGSSDQLAGGHQRWVQRNTLRLVAKAFPARWLPLVAYRQLGWAWHAWRAGNLVNHLAGTAAGLRQLPAAVRARRMLRPRVRIPIATVVPTRPVRGPDAGGHPSHYAGHEPGSKRPLTR